MKQVSFHRPLSIDSLISLDDKQAHHLFDVLRTGEKEIVRVVTEQGIYLARCKEKPMLYVFGKEGLQEPSLDITLCTALYKGKNFEWMLQKAAELGVSRIVPFVSANTIVQLEDPIKQSKKLARWQSILEAACNQSNRSSYVLLEPIQNLENLKDYKSKASLVAYEKESEHHLADALQDFPESITVVLGPEGGFEEREIESLKEQGFVPVSLGKNILRAETAACYVLSAIEYQNHLKPAVEDDVHL